MDLDRTSRYDPLCVYLSQQSDPVVRLRFTDIEKIIGGALPASARRYRPWWENEQAGRHVQAHSWLDAGRRTARYFKNMSLQAGIRAPPARSR